MKHVIKMELRMHDEADWARNRFDFFFFFFFFVSLQKSSTSAGNFPFGFLKAWIKKKLLDTNEKVYNLQHPLPKALLSTQNKHITCNIQGFLLNLYSKNWRATKQCPPPGRWEWEGDRTAFVSISAPYQISLPPWQGFAPLCSTFSRAPLCLV